MSEEKKREKPEPVKVLKVAGGAALVEWVKKVVRDGKSSVSLRRATVQAADVVEGCVEASALEAGIPYGIAWEEIRLPAPKPEQVADALRQAGIWTKDDLYRNPKAAIGALQAVYGLHLGALVEFAELAGRSGKESKA